MFKFSLRKKPQAVAPDIFPQSQIDAAEMQRLFARVFLSDDGKRVLSYLQKITVHKALGPDADEGQLRYLEGQRALVVTIMRHINQSRGR